MAKPKAREKEKRQEERAMRSNLSIMDLKEDMSCDDEILAYIDNICVELI